MHPAFSVLFFTVASGAGYGLISLSTFGYLVGFSDLQQQNTLLISICVAIFLITVGLLSSTFHLANPKNAWRSFSRFRTSWLSREAVFAVLFYPVALIYLAGLWFESDNGSMAFMLAGIASIILSLTTLFCTAMIYASLKTIRQWHTPLTPINYLLLGLASGATLLLAVQAMTMGVISDLLRNFALFFLVLGCLAKLLYFLSIGKPEGSTINTATGFTQASVRLLDQGHSSNGFLNNEFCYSVEANKLLRLRIIMFLSAFVFPMLLLALTKTVVFIVAAAILVLAGLLLERWLFFAEARHVVRLYHGDQRT